MDEQFITTAPAQPTMLDVWGEVRAIHVKVDLLILEKDRHNNRIKTLETWKAKVVGIALAASWFFSHIYNSR